MTSGSKFLRQVLSIMACVTVSVAQEQGTVAVRVLQYCTICGIGGNRLSSE